MNAIVVGLAMAGFCSVSAWALAALYRRAGDGRVVDMYSGPGGLLVPVLLGLAVVGAVIAVVGAVTVVVG